MLHTGKTTVETLAPEQGDRSHCPHRAQRCPQPLPVPIYSIRFFYAAAAISLGPSGITARLNPEGGL